MFAIPPRPEWPAGRGASDMTTENPYLSPGEPLPDEAIFIGGIERSGKTYVRLMLAAHPVIALSKRTNLWTSYYGRFGDLADDGALDRCLAAMWANKHVRGLEPDAESLRHEFRHGSRTYARLFALLHRGYTARLGKTRWGDQTEGIEEMAGPIFAALPNARLIHLIRDPRDRYEALGGGRPGRLEEATSRWLKSAELGARNERRYPDRYHLLRYETLARDPAATLRELCGFLGIDATDDMLALGHAGRFGDDWLGDSPISAVYVGRFREHLAGHELAYIQHRAGPVMACFGYAPEPVALSWTGRVLCDATPLAAALTRAAGRLVRNGPGRVEARQ